MAHQKLVVGNWNTNTVQAWKKVSVNGIYFDKEADFAASFRFFRSWLIRRLTQKAKRTFLFGFDLRNRYHTWTITMIVSLIQRSMLKHILYWYSRYCSQLNKMNGWPAVFLNRAKVWTFLKPLFYAQIFARHGLSHARPSVSVIRADFLLFLVKSRGPWKGSAKKNSWGLTLDTRGNLSLYSSVWLIDILQ